MNPKMIVEIVVAVIEKLQKKKSDKVAGPVTVMIPDFAARKKGKSKRRRK